MLLFQNDAMLNDENLANKFDAFYGKMRNFPQVTITDKSCVRDCRDVAGQLQTSNRFGKQLKLVMSEYYFNHVNTGN